MPASTRRAIAPLLALTCVALLAACGGAPAPAGVVRETVSTTDAGATSAPAAGATAAPAASGATASPAAGATSGPAASGATSAPAAGTTAAPVAGSFTTPHPILGDLRVRQALAYCTNRPELIKSVYGFLDDAQQKQLLMDTFLPQGHWALATDITTYPFDAAKGKALLEEANWKLPADSAVRRNAAGDELKLKFTTTDAQFRQTWATVLEKQLLTNCNIQIERSHVPAPVWFGEESGLSRRDFELGALAWVGDADPKGTTLYTCNNIPLPTNNWEGQNYMGWCNETASRAVLKANNTLYREERIKDFAIVQREFTKDMVSLPLFNRLEGEAATNNLVNFKSDPTEYLTANVDEWELKDGGTSLVIGMAAEPDTMFGLVSANASLQLVSYLIGAASVNSFNYDYQPGTLKQLPTVENGGATLTELEVKEGDVVWNTDGEAVPLAKGTEVVLNGRGETATFDGTPLKMQQLAVTFEYIDGLKWEDGEPLKKADYELSQKISCDKESGATSFNVCDSTQKVDYTSDTAYTVTYLPGAFWSLYSVFTIGASPSHQVLSDGRKLADVPAKEWSTLPEVAERPLSNGPYKMVEWEKGQRMVFEANANYYKGEPKIKKITVQFIDDTNQAVAQLLTGNVDVLGSDVLGAGPELQTVLDAGKEGTVQVNLVASPTWEHMDMNLFKP